MSSGGDSTQYAQVVMGSGPSALRRTAVAVATPVARRHYGAPESRRSRAVDDLSVRHAAETPIVCRPGHSSAARLPPSRYHLVQFPASREQAVLDDFGCPLLPCRVSCPRFGELEVAQVVGRLHAA